MPDPDTRKKNADPNDPDNVHTARATSAATVPAHSRNNWIIALVALVVILAVVYYALSGRTTQDASVGDGTQVEEQAEPTTEAPAAQGDAPAAGGSGETQEESAPATGN